MNKKENLFRVKRKPTIVVKMQTTAPDRSSLHRTLKRRGYFSSPEKKTCEIFVIIMVHTICCGCCGKRAFVVDCQLFMIVSVFVRIFCHLCMSSVKGSKVITLTECRKCMGHLMKDIGPVYSLWYPCFWPSLLLGQQLAC